MTTIITPLTSQERKENAADKLTESYRSYLADMQQLTAALGEALNSEAEEGDPIGILYGSMNHIVTMMVASLRKFEQSTNADAGKDMLDILGTLISNLDDTARIFLLSPTNSMMFAGVCYGLGEMTTTYHADMLNIASSEQSR